MSCATRRNSCSTTSKFGLERSFGHHRFGLVGTPPSELASPLDFRGDVTGLAAGDWRDAARTLLRAPRLCRRRVVARMDPAAGSRRDRPGGAARLVRRRRRPRRPTSWPTWNWSTCARVSRRTCRCSTSRTSRGISPGSMRRGDARIDREGPHVRDERRAGARADRPDVRAVRGRGRHHDRRTRELRSPRGRAAVDARDAHCRCRRAGGSDLSRYRAARQPSPRASCAGPAGRCAGQLCGAAARCSASASRRRTTCPGQAACPAASPSTSSTATLMLDSRDMTCGRCRGSWPSRWLSTPRAAP